MNLSLLEELRAHAHVQESKGERQSSPQAFPPSFVRKRREGGEEETRERCNEERERSQKRGRAIARREKKREKERSWKRGRAIGRERVIQDAVVKTLVPDQWD